MDTSVSKTNKTPPRGKAGSSGLRSSYPHGQTWHAPSCGTTLKSDNFLKAVEMKRPGHGKGARAMLLPDAEESRVQEMKTQIIRNPGKVILYVEKSASACSCFHQRCCARRMPSIAETRTRYMRTSTYSRNRRH